MDRNGWDDYYRSNNAPWAIPEEALMAEVEGMPPGRALDLGAGEGADSLALAQRGWEVTAVDNAPAAIATIERLASERGLAVRGVVGDITTFRADGLFDLVFSCYVHVGRYERVAMLTRAVTALGRGGTLIYIAFARTELQTDIPPELLATQDEVISELGGLCIVKSGVSRRTIGWPGGSSEADVMVVRARREAASKPS